MRDSGGTPQGRFTVLFWLAAFGGVLLIQGVVAALSTERISYTEFLRLAEEGRIERVEVSERFVRGTMTSEAGEPSVFMTTRVDPDLVDELAAQGIEVAGAIESNVIPTLLSWLIPIALFVGVWIWLSRRRAASAAG